MESFSSGSLLRACRTQRVKLVVLGAAISLAFLGVFARYVRRRRRQLRRAFDNLPTVLESPDGGSDGYQYRNCMNHSPSTSSARNAASAARNRRHRVVEGGSESSTASSRTLRQAPLHNLSHTLSPAQGALFHLAVKGFADVIKNLDEAITVGKLKRGREDVELVEGLEQLVDKSNALRAELHQFLLDHAGDSSDSVAFITVSDTSTVDGDVGGIVTSSSLPRGGGSITSHSCKRPMSILSDDSFVSALDDLIPLFLDTEDVLCRSPLKYDLADLHAYQAALKEVQAGNVQARACRTDSLHCSSDEDFLAKLYCVREAFRILLSEGTNRAWMVDTGRSLIASLMKQAGKDPQNFYAAFDKLLRYVENQERWPEIEQELRGRQVPLLSFYDVVLDFILLDAFDDLARPPASILAVAQNRFLSASFKESTLATVVWSVLKAKRARMQVSDGFVAHFYEVSEQVSPVMVWGFLGTNEDLRELCYYFKDQICNFLLDIFNFERVRYTTFDDLADDIWLICRRRAQMTAEKLGDEMLNI